MYFHCSERDGCLCSSVQLGRNLALLTGFWMHCSELGICVQHMQVEHSAAKYIIIRRMEV